MKVHLFTIDDLAHLVRDFQADCYDGHVSNDKAYIEEWIRKRQDTPVYCGKDACDNHICENEVCNFDTRNGQ